MVNTILQLSKCPPPTSAAIDFSKLSTLTLNESELRREDIELIKKNFHFPLPENKIDISEFETQTMILKAIDKYYLDFTKNFSNETRELINKYYFDNFNFEFADLNVNINAETFWEIYGDKIYFKLRIDKKFINTIDIKILKIHELAHIGQMNEIFKKLGADIFIKNTDFIIKLLEQTAAVLEKIIIDAIPSTNCSPRLLYEKIQTPTFSEYISLKYIDDPRNRYNLTTKDHEEFLSIPIIKDFIENKLKKVSPKSYLRDHSLQKTNPVSSKKTLFEQLKTKLAIAKSEVALSEKERVEALAAAKRANKILAEAEYKEAMLKIHTDSEARIDLLCTNFINAGKAFTDGIERVFKNCAQATKLYGEATEGFKEVSRICDQYSQEVKAKEAAASTAGPRTVVGNLRANPNTINAGNHGSSSAKLGSRVGYQF